MLHYVKVELYPSFFARHNHVCLLPLAKVVQLLVWYVCTVLRMCC